MENKENKETKENNKSVTKSVKSEVNLKKNTEKFQFNLEKFTQETISNITVEKAILISCLIFTIVCAIIGFWYLLFGMTNNKKYYNYPVKINSPAPSMKHFAPVTSSISKFMYLN